MSISRLDLNLLRVLDSVLSERSVVRAARRLHVTPSAISNALARLRSVLGDPLVIRSGRGVVPTPRAAGLASSLKRALSELERAVQSDTFDPATTTREFTLAISDAGQISYLPRLMKALAKEMPCSQLRVVGIDTYISSGGIAGTQVDVAIIAVAERLPGVHVMPLYKEESVLVARRGHPCARVKITRKQLGQLQHVDVHVAPGSGYRELAGTYAHLNIKREVALVVPSFIAAAAVVAHTDLVANLPTSLVENLGERLGIRAIPAPVPRITNEVKLVWHERTVSDLALRSFREMVARAVGPTSDFREGAQGQHR